MTEMTIARIRDAVRDVLSRLLQDTNHVLVQLDEANTGAFDDLAPSIDRELRGIFDRADGCRRYLTLYRPALRALYDPIEAARAQSAQLVGPSMASTMGKQFKGDIEQVKECLRLLLENGELAEGGTLALEVYVDGDHPRILARLTESANLPTVFRLPGSFSMPVAEFGERWNGATGGGRVDVTCSGLVMNLEGKRRAPMSCAWAPHVARPIIAVTRRLTPWRGAIGNYDYGARVDAETLGLYRSTTAKVYNDLREAVAQIPEM